MKSALFLLLLFFAAGYPSAVAKNIDVYVPPIVKLRLNNEEWKFPYSIAHQHLARTFMGKEEYRTSFTYIKTMTICSISIVYYKEPAPGKANDVLLGRKKSNSYPSIGSFDAYEPSYSGNGVAQIYFIDFSQPHVAVIVAVTKTKLPEEVNTLAKEFISKISYVAPREIDKKVGYPLPSNTLLDTLVAGRFARREKNTRYASSKIDDATTLIYSKDLRIGFNYHEFHEAKIKLLNNAYTDQEKRRFAFGLSEGLHGLLLVDSMTVSTYMEKKKSEDYLADYLLQTKKDSTAFTNALPIQLGEKESWWFFYKKEAFSIAHASASANGDVQFIHHPGKTTYWATNGPFFYTLQAALSVPTYGEKKQFFHFMGPEKNIIRFQSPTNRATPKGIDHLGLTTYYVDMRRPNAEMLVVSPAPISTSIALIYEHTGKQPDAKEESSYFRSSFTEYYRRYSRLSSGVFDSYYGHDHQDSFEASKIAFAEQEAISPEGKLFIGDLFTVSTGGATQLIRPFVSHEQVVFADVVEITTNGLQRKALTKEMIQALEQQLSFQEMKTKSALSYARLHDLRSPDEQIFGRIDPSELQKETKAQPMVFLTNPNDPNSYPWTLPDADLERIYALLNHPSTTKKTTRGGMVLTELQVTTEGKILAAKAISSVQGEPELSKEAEQLIMKFGQFSKVPDDVSDTFTLHISLQFLPE